MSEIQTSTGDHRPIEEPSTAIVTAVADAKNVDPVDLPPLYHVIDPDALCRLFRPSAAGSAAVVGRVTFPYAGCEVDVAEDGDVTVTLQDGENASADRT